MSGLSLAYLWGWLSPVGLALLVLTVVRYVAAFQALLGIGLSCYAIYNGIHDLFLLHGRKKHRREAITVTEKADRLITADAIDIAQTIVILHAIFLTLALIAILRNVPPPPSAYAASLVYALCFVGAQAFALRLQLRSLARRGRLRQLFTEEATQQMSYLISIPVEPDRHLTIADFATEVTAAVDAYFAAWTPGDSTTNSRLAAEKAAQKAAQLAADGVVGDSLRAVIRGHANAIVGSPPEGTSPDYVAIELMAVPPEPQPDQPVPEQASPLQA